MLYYYSISFFFINLVYPSLLLVWYGFSHPLWPLGRQSRLFLRYQHKWLIFFYFLYVFMLLWSFYLFVGWINLLSYLCGFFFFSGFYGRWVLARRGCLDVEFMDAHVLFCWIISCFASIFSFYWNQSCPLFFKCKDRVFGHSSTHSGRRVSTWFWDFSGRGGGVSVL